MKLTTATGDIFLRSRVPVQSKNKRFKENSLVAATDIVSRQPVSFMPFISLPSQTFNTDLQTVISSLGQIKSCEFERVFPLFVRANGQLHGRYRCSNEVLFETFRSRLVCNERADDFLL